MVNDLSTCKNPPQGINIPDIARESFDIQSLDSTPIVMDQTAHPIALCQKRPGQVAANQSGDTRDHCVCFTHPVCIGYNTGSN